MKTLLQKRYPYCKPKYMYQHLLERLDLEKERQGKGCVAYMLYHAAITYKPHKAEYWFEKAMDFKNKVERPKEEKRKPQAPKENNET